MQAILKQAYAVIGYDFENSNKSSMILKTQRQRNLLGLHKYISPFTHLGIHFLPQVQVHFSNKLYLRTPLFLKFDLNKD